MEVLKKQHQSKSKAKTFYGKFSRDSSESESSSSDDNGPEVFKFNVKAPVVKDSDTYSNWSGTYYSQPPISPGLTKNQDVKDQAYEKLFTRRIDDLKSEYSGFSYFTHCGKLTFFVQTFN